LGSGSQFKDLELRYCLRSLEKFGRGIRRVVIIGQRPKWLSDAAVHIFCPYFDGPKDARIAFKTLWAFQHTDISDEILFANDDYVFMAPFDVRLVPPYQRGTLLDAANRHDGNPSDYHQILKATHDLLTFAKLPADFYDIHVPIRYVREKFIALRPWWDKAKAAKNGLVIKSIYSNVTRKGLAGPFLADCKVGEFTTADALDRILAKQFPGRFVMSYSDTPLYDNFEEWLYRHFPAKSRFEV
jgi:hypothetical protein